MTLVMVPSPNTAIWRVGYRPEPLAWSGWEHAVNGVFPGRWDDPNGRFRTMYLAESLVGCLLEVLAHARKEPYMVAALGEIEEDPEDAREFPTLEPGTVDRAWLGPRCAANVVLYGKYCRVTATETISALYPLFIAATLKDGHDDFDASVLKSGGARTITRAVAAHLYLVPHVNGVEFNSRHGDEAKMWSVFEQPQDSPVSGQITKLGQSHLEEDTPELVRAFELLGLTWANWP
ncbi:RES family NAD+ phosphorylase [Paenarthrobacter sp. Z7-10]|uniref:RES family NAD+ phosphorylase n=1 Tax=Paenarthrobacter sp. Z7-10 TaxID=2787635 RepID=UPI002E78C9BB|nr:RES family NAD+ phosphorylase [Paenarthrobacter sp. Z7-10]MCZ2403460.1 RES family NAD+ phosphorylase [Paenarthrobacter sp. Z7-10]